MLNLGGMEILVILVVALLILEPDKLPKFMRTIGKAVGDLRRVSSEFQRTVTMAIDTDGDKPAPKLNEQKNLNVEQEVYEPKEQYPDPQTAETASETSLSKPSSRRKFVLRAKPAKWSHPRQSSNDTDTP